MSVQVVHKTLVKLTPDLWLAFPRCEELAEFLRKNKTQKFRNSFRRIVETVEHWSSSDRWFGYSRTNNTCIDRLQENAIRANKLERFINICIKLFNFKTFLRFGSVVKQCVSGI